jgi:hypothetical protein
MPPSFQDPFLEADFRLKRHVFFFILLLRPDLIHAPECSRQTLPPVWPSTVSMVAGSYRPLRPRRIVSRAWSVHGVVLFAIGPALRPWFFWRLGRCSTIARYNCLLNVRIPASSCRCQTAPGRARCCQMSLHAPPLKYSVGLAMISSSIRFASVNVVHCVASWAVRPGGGG